jgi:hypothetical protein
MIFLDIQKHYYCSVQVLATIFNSLNENVDQQFKLLSKKNTTLIMWYLVHPKGVLKSVLIY